MGIVNIYYCQHGASIDFGNGRFSSRYGYVNERSYIEGSTEDVIIKVVDVVHYSLFSFVLSVFTLFGISTESRLHRGNFERSNRMHPPEMKSE